ncbi:hypothetical protein AX17_006743, partial [Amanita inopinata Kibby_2008]
MIIIPTAVLLGIFMLMRWCLVGGGERADGNGNGNGNRYAHLRSFVPEMMSVETLPTVITRSNEGYGGHGIGDGDEDEDANGGAGRPLGGRGVAMRSADDVWWDSWAEEPFLSGGQVLESRWYRSKPSWRSRIKTRWRRILRGIRSMMYVHNPLWISNARRSRAQLYIQTEP